MRIHNIVFTFIIIFTITSFLLISTHLIPLDLEAIGISQAYAQTKSPITCSVTNGGPGLAIGSVGSIDPLTINLGVSFGQGYMITPTNATLNFGDGSPAITSINKTRLGEFQITHTYQKSGNYVVSITVFGSEYNSDNISNIVHTQETCQVIISQPTQSLVVPSTVTVATDKSSYSYGDPVIISGKVTNPISSTNTGQTTNLMITIQGQGSTGQIGPITVNPDGSFSQVIQHSSFASVAGSYTVTAQYGAYVSPSVTFYYQVPSMPQTTTSTSTASASPPNITITIDKSSYNCGDLLTVSGVGTNMYSTNQGGPMNQLYITIFGPNNSQGEIGPIKINPDGSFSQIIHPTSFANNAGSYTVSAQYGYGGLVNGKISQGQSFSGPTFYYACDAATPTTSSQQTVPQQTTVSSSQASNTGITVTTDKSSYGRRDPITISGTISTPVPNTLVTILVRNPTQQVVSTSQIPIGTDGLFSTIVMPTSTDNGLWQSAGTYLVFVQYANQSATAQTTFQFSGVNDQPTTSPIQQTIPVLPTTTPSSQCTTAYCYLQQEHNNGTSLPLNPSNNSKSFVPQVSIRTDKSSYNYGDLMTISGHVSTAIAGIPLIIILEGQNSEIHLGQVNLNPDGSFSDQVYASGPMWTKTSPDNYVVTARYDSYTFSGSSIHFSNNDNYITKQNVSSTLSELHKIPKWVKNMFNMYEQGEISDDELLGAIKFLVDSKIIQLQSK